MHTPPSCAGSAGYLVDALDTPNEVTRALDWNLAGPGGSCGLRAADFPRMLLSLLRQAAGEGGARAWPGDML
jgi:hypothetical protein